MTRLSARALLVAALIGAHPGAGRAFVPVDITPEMVVGGGYDDNVFLQPGRGEGGLIAQAIPRLTVSIPLKRMDVTLDQSFYYYYNGPQGQTEAYQVQGKAAAFLIKDLLVSVSDRYLLVPVEVGRPGYTPSNLTRVNELDFGAVFNYDLTPRTTSQWKYDFIRDDLFGVFRASFYAHRASLEIKREMTDALSVFIDYSFLYQRYFLGGAFDLAIHEGDAGVVFALRDLKAKLSGGAQSLDSGPSGRTSGAVARADVSYDLSERLVAKAAYAYTMSLEVIGSTYVAHIGQAGMTYTLGPRVQASLQGEGGRYVFNGTFLTRTYWSGEAKMTYEIVPDTSLGLTYDHYEGKDNAGMVVDNRYFLEFRWVVR